MVSIPGRFCQAICRYSRGHVDCRPPFDRNLTATGVSPVPPVPLSELKPDKALFLSPLSRSRFLSVKGMTTNRRSRVESCKILKTLMSFGPVYDER